MCNRIACFVAALLMASAVTAGAGNQAATFSISPYVGGYVFDGVEHQEMGPVGGIRAGYNFTENLGTEASFGFALSDRTSGAGDVKASNYNLDLLYHFMPKNSWVPFLAAGYGGRTVDYSSYGTHTKGAFNYGGGIKYFMTEACALRADVRQFYVDRMTPDESFYSKKNLFNEEVSVGVSFIFGGAKPVPAPVAAPPPVIAPPPPAAPTASLTVTPAVVIKGQPATLNWSCQNASSAEIKPEIGVVPLQGSRGVTPSDTTVYALSCSGEGGSATSEARVSVSQPAPPPAPTASLTATPAAITKGQPATLNWTSMNATDCSLQPGIGPVQPQGSMNVTPGATTAYSLSCQGAGGTVASDARVTVTEQLCIKLEIEFDTAKADIKKKYHDEIGKVAEFLKTYPDATGTIEGHTDNVGGADYNQKLSQRRADAVMSYLVDKYGVDKGRLSAKGYGLTKPIADNKTPEGRQKNRRIMATFDCVILTKNR